jgi:hypothetical protein
MFHNGQVRRHARTTKVTQLKSSHVIQRAASEDSTQASSVLAGRRLLLEGHASPSSLHDIASLLTAPALDSTLANMRTERITLRGVHNIYSPSNRILLWNKSIWIRWAKHVTQIRYNKCAQNCNRKTSRDHLADTDVKNRPDIKIDLKEVGYPLEP